MNPYKVEMFLDKANQWRWRIRRSGKVLVSSEAYSRRGGCRRTAARVAAALNVAVEVEE